MRAVLRAMVVLAVVVLVLYGTMAVSGRALRVPTDPLYTPVQFAAVHLRAHLKIGQTLRITGILKPWWGPGSGAIMQAQGWPPIGVFVIYGPRSPLVAWLRRLPLFGGLIPPTADLPLVDTVATFRVRAIPCRSSIPLCPWRSPALQLQDGGTP